MMQPSASRDWERWRNAAFREPWLSFAEERALLALAQAGSRDALQTLCASHLRLIVQLACKYRRSGVHVDDLISEGSLGFIEAVGRFDISQTTRISTYAAWWIRARVRRHVFRYRNVVTPPSTVGARIARSRMILAERKLSQQLGRLPTPAEVAMELGVDEDEVWEVRAEHNGTCSLGDDANGPPWEPAYDGPTPEELVSRSEQRQLQRRGVRAALETLEQRDRQIVSAHFSADDITMADLGSALGVSRQRVSQIVKRVCKQLAHDLRGVAAETTP